MSIPRLGTVGQSFQEFRSKVYALNHTLDFKVYSLIEDFWKLWVVVKRSLAGAELDVSVEHLCCLKMATTWQKKEGGNRHHVMAIAKPSPQAE